MTRRDYLVTVCDKCRMACCWHGEFMCDEAQAAGTVDVLASELRKEKNEHPSHFAMKRLREICGDVVYAEDQP